MCTFNNVNTKYIYNMYNIRNFILNKICYFVQIFYIKKKEKKNV